MIILYTSFLIIGFYCLIKKNKRLGFTGAYAGFVFGIILYYVVIPILFIICEKTIMIYSGWEFIYVKNFIYSHGFYSWNAFYSFLISIIGFIFFNIGYNFFLDQKANFGSINNKSYYTLKFESKSLLKIINTAGIITFIIGGASFTLFIKAIGGISRMLSLAEILRQHDSLLSDYVSSGIGGLMIVPSALLPVSSILLFYVILYRKKLSHIFLFCISLVLSSIYLLFNAGRFPIIRFGIIFLYMIISKKRKHAWLIIIIISICALPVLNIFDSLFVYFSTKVWVVKESIYLTFLRQFSHPTMLLFNTKDFTQIYGYRFFKDLVTDVLSLLPRVNFEMSYVNTSEFIKGPNWRELGGIPNDAFFYGYIQLGIVGVSIFLFILGCIMAYIDRKIKKMPKSRNRDYLAVVAAVNVFTIVRTAELYTLIKYNPILIVMIIIYIIYTKKLKKISYKERQLLHNNRLIY